MSLVWKLRMVVVLFLLEHILFVSSFILQKQNFLQQML